MTLIATIDTFTKEGVLVRRGQPVNPDAVDYDEEKSTNLAKVGDFEQAVVEVSAIAPTGPNPKAPQQLGPGSVQTNDGYVNDAGSALVGEVTLPEKQRIIVTDDDAEAKATEALAEADRDAQRLSDSLTGAPTGDGNVDNAGTEGTVAEVSERVASMDAAQLDQLEKAENDREVARKGVLSAIEKRRAELALTS